MLQVSDWSTSQSKLVKSSWKLSEGHVSRSQSILPLSPPFSSCWVNIERNEGGGREECQRDKAIVQLLWKENQPWLQVCFVQGKAGEAEPAFPHWKWCPVSSMVCLLTMACQCMSEISETRMPSVEATNTSYYVKITIVILSFIKMWGFSGDTGAQNITPVIKTKPTHPLN